MKYVSNLHTPILIIWLLMLALCCVSDADARISAEAGLSYTNYDAKDNTGRHLTGSAFTQDYSLLYDSTGPVYNSRIGRYNVAIGYNWTALDTTIKGTNLGLPDKESFNESRGHFFYNGDVLIDPKELPFRLNAYSRDMTKNTLASSDTALITTMFSQNGGMLLGTPNLANGINDGIHIESGATLVAGVKNGMTNGYNEVLRHLPMIMLDYKDQINRDLRSLNPTDNRLSRLAFVSLNKKDNWFHYRFTTFEDNITHDNNYNESQVQIGTVDQVMARRWIDFSNWIKVSTDIQFTKRNNIRMNESFQEVELNLFAEARRASWELRTYNYFDRYREDNGKLTYLSYLPVYTSGIVNQNLSWQARTSYRDSHDSTGARLNSALIGYQVEAFKKDMFNLTHTFDVESSTSETTTTNADVIVIAAGVETASNRRFSSNYNLAASYKIKDIINRTNNISSDFFVHNLTARVGYVPSNQVLYDLKQEFEVTHGTYKEFSSNVREFSTAIPQYQSPRSTMQAAAGASTFRSLTNATVSWNPQPRWRYSLSGSEDIYLSEVTSQSTISNLRASVDYSSQQAKLSNILSYTENNDPNGGDSKSINERATLTYTINRNLTSKGMFNYFSNKQDNLSSKGYDLEQQLNYDFYTTSGVGRKLFEISEIATYSNSPALDAVRFYTANTNYDYTTIVTTHPGSSSIISSSSRTRRGSLALGAKYHILRQVQLSAGTRYMYENSLDNYSLMWYSSISANYRLLQASLDYYQGKRQSDGLIERKISANVKKQF